MAPRTTTIGCFRDDVSIDLWVSIGINNLPWGECYHPLSLTSTFIMPCQLLITLSVYLGTAYLSETENFLLKRL